ncbi:helix-turn-helix domain-containing protein [Paenibacillus taiwanensis]|uniref:helix-turn-helix domain-containing protein n=1 Tax=Paenibacillus taiwanensis TaxID=401638 RepID=UPI000420BBEE|nr:helix-turn-helix domain-containing protein [Paenibacillus taiwanensis]
MTDISTSTLTSGLGELIRSKRIDKQMTLPQASELSGIPEEMLSRIESGESTAPEFRSMLALATTLNIPIEEMTETYIELERSSESLFTVLKEAIPRLLPIPLIMKIATQLLTISQRETSEDSVERLYALATETQEIPRKLALFKVISQFTDDHSIRPTLAKSLLQSYLIERGDLRRLGDSYEYGRSIQYHVKFLPVDDQIVYYYKIGVHAYHLGKYEDCIQHCKKVLTLDYSEGTTKAEALLLSASSYFLLGLFDSAEKYVRLLKAFNFPWLNDQVDFLQAKIDSKKISNELAIVQIEKFLDKHPHKVVVMYDLLDLYLKQNDVNAIERLIKHEKDFIDFTSTNHPLLISEHAVYFSKKSEYYFTINNAKEGFHNLFKSIIMFISVDRHREASSNIGMLLSVMSRFPSALHSFEKEFHQVIEYLQNNNNKGGAFI